MEFDGPDALLYMSQEALDWRKKADEHAKLRKKLADDSKAAFSSGDKGRAKELSDQAKKEFTLFEEANAKAVELIFEHNNAKHGLETIDLHGLQVAEAIAKLEERVQKAKSSVAELVVIVGKGNHSVNNVRKILPAVKEFAATHKYPLADDTPHEGYVQLTIGSGSGKAPADSGTAPNDNKASTKAKKKEEKKAEKKDTSGDQSAAPPPAEKKSKAPADPAAAEPEKKKKKKKAHCIIL
eukprot:TRINITY_DN5339_c0_g1_i1.p1 TRINITY_DN5339_c0_g1~~TRINITY_DN5339_c0_g1_i1.p1  ORF type:complete len:239 (-),score=92.35 TRINITY_DN5339_c0_g1_i1:339-1055(-)